MKYIILVVFISVITLIGYYSVKYKNPYKLIFLFGKKGSGKTTMLVRYMVEYHKKGYNIYTNMNEINLPYVVHIDVNDIGKYVAMPKSMLALDEVGTIWDARRFKTFSDETRDYFKFQRQYKNVVVMTSQVWDIDKKVRDLTDSLYLCGKIGPFCYARKIRRTLTLTEPMGDSESRIADRLEFGGGIKLIWLPKWGKLYQSFAPPERPFFVAPPSEIIKKENKVLCRKASAPGRRRHARRSQ